MARLDPTLAALTELAARIREKVRPGDTLNIPETHYLNGTEPLRLLVTDGPVAGMSPFELLGPIGFLACLVISALAYATVGFQMRKENAREEAVLERARRIHGPALLRIPAGSSQHR